MAIFIRYHTTTLTKVFSLSVHFFPQVRLSQSQGLGLTIFGGRGSQNGDVPIYVKRIQAKTLRNPATISAGGRQEAEEWGAMNL